MEKHTERKKKIEDKVQMLSRLLGKVERAENDPKSVLKIVFKIVPEFVFRIFPGMSQ